MTTTQTLKNSPTHRPTTTKIECQKPHKANANNRRKPFWVKYMTKMTIYK